MNIESYHEQLVNLQKDQLKTAETLHSFYDKALLYLASGAIVFSVSFLKDVIGDDDIQMRWLLIASWSLFPVSILSILGSYLVSQSYFTKRIRTVGDEKMRIGKEPITDDMPDRLADMINKLSAGLSFYVRIFNTLATTSFGVGILSMSVFSIVNVW